MGELIFHISALTEQGTYEFDVPTDAEEFADRATDALAAGVAVFKTTNGETVMLNGQRLLGVIISRQQAADNEE